MRNALGVLSLLLLNLAFAKPLLAAPNTKRDLCTIPVVLLIGRSSCHPLMKLWVVRKGQCKEARQCLHGYTKQECEAKCLVKKTTIKPLLSTRRKTKTCYFPFELTTEHTNMIESTTNGVQSDLEGSTDTTGTIGTMGPRTRRTRRPRTTPC